MIVFRLSATIYASDLSGRGAEQAGGRWNNKGTALVYTSESRALAMLEVAVHLPLGIMARDYSLITIQLPEEPVSSIYESSLPPDWKAWPPPVSTRSIGEQFVKKADHLILKVPSALVPGEFNFLINPKHPKASALKILSIHPFVFDSRMFNR
jgi:RES domain-containing protein